jgi:hypothetical protein
MVLTAAVSGVAGCVSTSGGTGSSTTSIGDLFHVTVTDSSNDGPDLLRQTFGGTLVVRGAEVTSGEEAIAQKVLSENRDALVTSWETEVLGEIRMKPHTTEVRSDGTSCRAYGIRYSGTGKYVGWTNTGGVACRDQSGVWRKT